MQLSLIHICPPTGALSNFRMSNLAYNSQPLDLLLADGRVVYTCLLYTSAAFISSFLVMSTE